MRQAILHAPDGLGGVYPLGTDDVGRDVFSRLLYGARLSLSIGAVVVTLSLLVGTLLGLIAGFAGGVVEALIMRLMDIMLAAADAAAGDRHRGRPRPRSVERHAGGRRSCSCPASSG